MARTKLFALLRKTYEKARLATELGTTDPTTLEASWRARREADARTRREMLSAFGTAAALGALGVTTTACGDDSGDDGDPPSTDEKVAVIGGGIAGLHCAHRLHAAGVDVTVYELQDRVGGRMFSGADLFLDGQVCELGGELIDSNHATLFALATELGIELDDRLAGLPDGHVLDTYVIQGVTISDTVILQQFQSVADTLAADTAAADEEDGVAYAALDAQSLDAYLKEKVPVADYPDLHAVLQTAYRGEFGLETPEQSALNMLYLIGSDDASTFRIFGESDERYHTHAGNDAFPKKLAEKLDPAKIKLGYRLVAASDGDAGFDLTFTTASGASETVNVTRVVFALPYSVLRDVDLTGLTLSAEKRDIIQNLGYGTNAKVMGGFTRRFWIDDYNASGSLYTDGGIQQTWDTSIGQTGTSGILTNFLGGERGLESATGTPEAWWAENLAELDAVWPGAVAAFTGTAVRMHWPSADGFKGSYTCYRPGQWAYYGTEGAREGNLHFCGEHTSADFQGWMEGGAESGGLVAAEILDELGVDKSVAHVQSLGLKLAVPQPTYAGGGSMVRADGRRLNYFQRRRAIVDVVRRARAIHASGR